MAADGILAGYAADADALIPQFEALDTPQVLAPMLHLLPQAPCRVLDVGAGTGRDAAWLAAQGHQVLAVEPTAPLREAGKALHRLPNLQWLDDRLPDLARVRARGETYDLVLIVGVWQHLPPADHERAVTGFAPLLAPGGRLLASLRHGPGAPTRPCFPAAPEAVIAAGQAAGLRLVLREEAGSIQLGNRLAGVTWTWLALERPA